MGLALWRTAVASGIVEVGRLLFTAAQIAAATGLGERRVTGVCLALAPAHFRPYPGGPGAPGGRLTDHIARVLPHLADREDAGLHGELVALIEAVVRGDRRRATRLMTALETHLTGIGLPLEAPRV
jgi:hypothetical protein